MKLKIKEFVKGLDHYFRVIRVRRNFGKQDLEKKLKTMVVSPINNNQRLKIEKFWQNYPVKVDYRWFDVYNTLAPDAETLEYYMPHDIYYCYVDPFFSNVSKAKAFDDKNMYDIYFHDVLQPRTILRINNGIYTDAEYQLVSLNKAIELCYQQKNVIIKPSIETEGGAGIEFWDSSRDSKDILLAKLKGSGCYIISEIVKQHSELARIHDSSVNTIRIITLLLNNEVHILSAILRMGVNGARIDNASSGGIFCGINPDGSLKSRAYDVKGNVYYTHPQGGKISNYRIPSYDMCCQTVVRLAPRLCNVTKLCSWDLSIDKYGTPILIEANLTYGGINLHQMCNGPILGSLTRTVLDAVFKK